MLAIPDWLCGAMAVALLLWIAGIAALGVALAIRAAGILGPAEARFPLVTPQMAVAATLVCLACLLAALVTRRLLPPATFPVTFITGTLTLVLAAISSGTVGALLVTLAIVVLAGLVGDTVLARLPLPTHTPVVRLPLAFALGFGLLGGLDFVLAAIGQLTAPAVLAGGALLVALAITGGRAGMRSALSRLRYWRPETPTWCETVVVGVGVGLVAFSLLSAFVPENVSDALANHLPIAREVWQSGGAPVFTGMSTSRDPIQGHLLFAVAWGFGGMTAVKLLNAAAGISAILGVAGIGWMVGGRPAAVMGAAIFATMPLTLWLMGHTFPELFTVLFATAAALGLLLWQRDGARVWLVWAGLLAGCGVAAKTTTALLGVALAAAIFLVGRGPWRWRERVQTTLLFALGAAVTVAPWILRTYLLTGSLSPDLERMTGIVLGRVPGLAGSVPPSDTGTALAGQPALGTANWLRDMVLGLWTLTFHAEEQRFPVVGEGEIGIALLMLLPLVIFAPRTRAVALLVIAAAVSYVGWAFTPHQIARHLLPTLAILAALAGIGVASVAMAAPGASWLRRALAAAAPLALLLGLFVIPFFILPNNGLPSGRPRIPVEVILGQESAQAYVARQIPAAAAIAATNALPPETLVAYTGGPWGGAQIYTEARLVYFAFRPLAELGTDAAEVLATLERQGISYLIWYREATSREDERSTLLSTAFLRDHTRILAGDRNGYLFEILPADNLTWGESDPPNLLADPELETAGQASGSWTASGAVAPARNGITLPAGGSLAQRVVADAGRPYLLEVAGSCDGRGDPLRLSLRWLDAQGSGLGVTEESVNLTNRGSEQFLWRRAPADTAAVVAEVVVAPGAACDLASASLFALS